MKVKPICFLKILDSHQVENETVIQLEEANSVITLRNASRFHLQQHFSASGWLTPRGILCGGSCPVLLCVSCVFSIDPLGSQQQFSLPLLVTTKNVSRHRQIWGKITPPLQVLRPKHDSLLVPQKGTAGASETESPLWAITTSTSKGTRRRGGGGEREDWDENNDRLCSHQRLNIQSRGVHRNMLCLKSLEEKPSHLFQLREVASHPPPLPPTSRGHLRSCLCLSSLSKDTSHDD